MTDIVERLRFKKELKTPEDVHVLFADAADEIERLREERDEARRGEHRENENTPTWAELTAYWKARAEELERDRVVAPHATTENERLREALRKCLPVMRKAHDRIHCLPRTSDTDLAEAIDIALGVARAALGEKE